MAGLFSSPSVTPRRIFFEVEFPIFPYRKYRGGYRISLNPIEIPTRTYVNPIEVALEYQEVLDSGKYQNQADLAKSLNVTRPRVNQYIRILGLPDAIQDDILSGRIKATERQLRRLLTVR